MHKRVDVIFDAVEKEIVERIFKDDIFRREMRNLDFPNPLEWTDEEIQEAVSVRRDEGDRLWKLACYWVLGARFYTRSPGCKAGKRVKPTRQREKPTPRKQRHVTSRTSPATDSSGRRG